MLPIQGLKIDLANRQLTIDFVNQSAAQQSTLNDLEPTSTPSLASSAQSERTDFAERLGQMNKRYLGVSSDVDDRLKRLEMQQLKWEQYEKGVNNLVNWFTNQEGAVKKFQLIGHQASVEQALKDCKVSTLVRRQMTKR